MVWCSPQKCIPEMCSGIQRCSSWLHISQNLLLAWLMESIKRNYDFVITHPEDHAWVFRGYITHKQSTRDISDPVLAHEPALRWSPFHSWSNVIPALMCVCYFPQPAKPILTFFLFLSPTILYWFKSVQANEIGGGTTTCVWTNCQTCIFKWSKKEWQRQPAKTVLGNRGIAKYTVIMV